MIKFLDLRQQYLSIKNEIDGAIAAVIKDSAFIGGKYTGQFEEHFAEYQQAAHCVGVGNGTDALEIAIESLGLPPGSEIIVPANSFVASAEAIQRSGHQVVFCDVNGDDYTIDINDIKQRITQNTSAIVAVHLYGHPCDMDPLLSLAGEKHLRVIEDCAQAHGAEYKGRRVGTIGDIGTFSFFPGKNLGAYGDGGAIVTDCAEMARKCRMLANHGRLKKYDHEIPGRNSRLDGLQAAVLDVKLNYLEDWTEHRIRMADAYLQQLSQSEGIVLPHKKEWARHVYHLFVIRVSGRDGLKTDLAEAGIQTGIHYPHALPQLGAFNKLDQSYDHLTANQFGEDLLSLPMGGHIECEDVQMIVGQVMTSLLTCGISK
ncbi:DegT/DnrJ/EryC1/StrS family aminotransferase [Planctomycetota bacterium]